MLKINYSTKDRPTQTTQFDQKKDKVSLYFTEFKMKIYYINYDIFKTQYN